MKKTGSLAKHISGDCVSLMTHNFITRSKHSETIIIAKKYIALVGSLTVGLYLPQFAFDHL
jgi:hypothetical protein